MECPENHRLADEKAFHEAQSETRFSRANFQKQLSQDDEAYLDHASWIRPGFEALGDLNDKNVLDWGCGHGMASVCLANRGAHVHSLDLSHGYCKEVKLRAITNGLGHRILPFQGDACRLPLPAESMDAIWGNAILHHVPPDKAAVEIRRVLKPGGNFVLCDPWKGSWALQSIRKFAPYPGKARTRDEYPLDETYLVEFQAQFGTVEISHWDLLGGLQRLVPLGPLTGPIRLLDRFLFRLSPFLAKSSRYVMICGKKGA